MTKVYRHDSLIVQEILAVDPMLGPIFNKTEEVVLTLQTNYFDSLASTILAQQLSGKVAEVINKRLLAFFGGVLTPEKLLSTKDDDLRQLGISYPKIKYLKSLAEHISLGLVDFTNLDTMDDEAIIAMLVQIKGIGRWTAEMFLIFVVGREDVFSVLDLGLRNAVKAIYGKALTNDEISLISQRWSPYKSIVCHFLWHSYDNA